MASFRNRTKKFDVYKAFQNSVKNDNRNEPKMLLNGVDVLRNLLRMLRSGKTFMKAENLKIIVISSILYLLKQIPIRLSKNTELNSSEMCYR